MGARSNILTFSQYCQSEFIHLTALYVNMQFNVAVSMVYFNHKETVDTNYWFSIFETILNLNLFKY